MAAQIDGDIVVFLIRLRVNSCWKVHKWLPLVKAKPRLLKGLDELPAEETGYLGSIQSTGTTMIQYWRSFDHLEAYARPPPSTGIFQSGANSINGRKTALLISGFGTKPIFCAPVIMSRSILACRRMALGASVSSNQ